MYPCRIKTQSTLAHEISYIVNIGQYHEYSDAADHPCHIRYTICYMTQCYFGSRNSGRVVVELCYVSICTLRGNNLIFWMHVYSDMSINSQTHKVTAFSYYSRVAML